MGLQFRKTFQYLVVLLILWLNNLQTDGICAIWLFFRLVESKFLDGHHKKQILLVSLNFMQMRSSLKILIRRRW